MRLTVFGATGAVGQEVVRQALAAGHEVTAVVRDPARLPEGLRGVALHAVVPLGDESAVRGAVAGRDAVLSGLGARGRKAGDVTERLTVRVLEAMEAEGVRRLLVVSAAPVGPAAGGRPVAGPCGPQGDRRGPQGGVRRSDPYGGRVGRQRDGLDVGAAAEADERPADGGVPHGGGRHPAQRPVPRAGRCGPRDAGADRRAAWR